LVSSLRNFVTNLLFSFEGYHSIYQRLSCV